MTDHHFDFVAHPNLDFVFDLLHYLLIEQHLQQHLPLHLLWTRHPPALLILVVHQPRQSISKMFGEKRRLHTSCVVCSVGFVSASPSCGMALFSATFAPGVVSFCRLELFCSTTGSELSGTAGVVGVATAGALLIARSFSRFFSSDFKKALTVRRRVLFGLQSTAAIGLWAQTGHDSGNEDWPRHIL